MSDLWKELSTSAKNAASRRITGLFDADSARLQRMSCRLGSLYADFSKNNIDAGEWKALIELARSRKVEETRDQLFAGAPVNVSENRAVLHSACRAGEAAPQEIKDTLAQMRRFAAAVQDGSHKGFGGKAITDIVTIGIGGSTLGPSAAIEALRHWHHPRLSMHFVTNVEASDLHHALATLDPETTLFVISSKSFTTPETMMNAEIARDHIVRHFGDKAAVARHFAALSTNLEAVRDFGIEGDNMFPFREWVGGRFSGWSAIGLPIMLMIGPDNFDAWLAGAREMDEHFKTAPLDRNIPVLLAMVGIWHRNFCGFPAYAVVPYHSAMRRLPAWLQQVDMESNGKSVFKDGRPTDIATGPIVLGEPGTDAQHSFFQWIHQSADIVPVDFIAAIRTPFGVKAQQNRLLANMIAQGESLMRGQENKAQPHRHFNGNKPSTTLLVDELTPHSLGMIMAMYEHKIFVQGTVWDINSFDQFGVELGKVMAKAIEDELNTGKAGTHDASTTALIEIVGK